MRRLLPLLFCLLSATSHAAWREEFRLHPFASHPPSSRMDQDVVSPKSVHYAPDGHTIWVQALERGVTLVYDAATKSKLATIPHRFAPTDAFVDADVFADNRRPFAGKPVESVFTHAGKYLWVTSYRKDWDAGGHRRSTVTVIDTATYRPVRVMSAPPVPKFIAWSAATGRVAVVGWGDNSVEFWEAPTADPSSWKRGATGIAGGTRYAPVGAVTDRDRQCGFCLRGSVFTPTGDHLLVARMGGGGMSVFDPVTGREEGVWRTVAPTPRHLVLTPDGKTLLIASCASGILSSIDLQDLLPAILAGKQHLPAGKTLHLGAGARTLALSPDGTKAYVALNSSREFAEVDLVGWRVLARHAAPPFPVGLAVAPDGREVALTAQGKKGVGGHVVSFWRPSP